MEEVTSSPFEDLTIQDPRDSSGAFPFRALLDFVEASCENPLQDLVILHSEELRNHKIKLIQLVQERYSAAFAEHFDAVYRQINSSPYLHHRIFELQVELSKMNATLKKQETDLAVLSSALNHQTLGGYYGPKGVDPETDPDIELSHKRRRPSQPSQSSQQYGFDGVDDRTMDTPTRRSTYASSDRRPSGSASSHSYHGSDIPVQHVPRGLPPVPMHLSKDGGLIAVQLLASHLKPLLRLSSDIPLGLPLYLPLIQALIDSLCHHRMNLALTLPV